MFSPLLGRHCEQDTDDTIFNQKRNDPCTIQQQTNIRILPHTFEMKSFNILMGKVQIFQAHPNVQCLYLLIMFKIRTKIRKQNSASTFWIFARQQPIYPYTLVNKMGAYEILNYRITVDFYKNYSYTVIKLLYKYRHHSIFDQKLYLTLPVR